MEEDVKTEVAGLLLLRVAAEEVASLRAGRRFSPSMLV